MKRDKPGKILVIVGPTASGKSELAVRLAQAVGAEIVNADSMQVYRGLDIGTAKPSIQEQGGIPHHLIDAAAPDQPYSAADFAGEADQAIARIAASGKRAIVVGGTGLYIRALLHGLVASPGADREIRRQLQAEADQLGNAAMLERLRQVDPELAAGLHPNNLVRIIRGLEVQRITGIPLSRFQQQHGFAGQRYQSIKIGIRVPRQELYERIEARVDRMLSAGLVDEVRNLLSAGYGRDLKSMRSIGYKEITACLAGECSLEEAALQIKQSTRNYAKRQLTWFNHESDIIWLEYPEKFATISTHVIEFFDRQEE